MSAFLPIAYHYLKSVHIWDFSEPYFPAFRLHMETYLVNLSIQSEYGKYGPEKLRKRTLFVQRILTVFTACRI